MCVWSDILYRNRFSEMLSYCTFTALGGRVSCGFKNVVRNVLGSSSGSSEESETGFFILESLVYCFLISFLVGVFV